MLLVVPDDPSIVRWLPGVVLMAIGTGISFPAVQGGPVVDMAPDQYAVAMGFNQTVQRIGSAIGNAIAIVFVASTGYVGGFDRMFSVMLVCSMMLFGLGVSLRYRTVGGFAAARA
jgi:predicted MFS family arabinose efflux permease